MGERHTEGSAGSEYSIDLTKNTIEVFSAGEGIDRQREVDLVGPNERNIGKIAMMEFELDLVDFRELSSCIDASDVVIDGDDVGPGQRQTDCVMPETDTKLQDLLSFGRRDESKCVVPRKIWAPTHSVER